MPDVLIPTNPHVLIILILIPLILITIFLFARKIGLKQLICAVLLSSAAIFWIMSSLDEDLAWPPTTDYIHIFNFVPFDTLFLNPDGGWPDTQSHMLYITPIVWLFALNFVFGIVWGCLSPVVFKINSTAKYVVLTISILLPLQLFINMTYIFYVSMSRRFDMGNYILLALGCTLGRLIFNGKGSLRKRKQEQ